VLSTKTSFLPYALAVLIGAVAQLIPLGLSHGDATTQATYWVFGSLPAIILLSGGLAFAFADHPFFWPVIILTADFLTGIATTSGDLNLLPIGIVLYAIYLIPCFLMGWAGRYMHKRYATTKQQSA
jgi:hypothetical protein